MNLNIAFLLLSLALIFVSVLCVYREMVHSSERQLWREQRASERQRHRSTLEPASYTPQQMQLRRLEVLLYGKKFAGDVKIADLAARVEDWPLSKVERLVFDAQWSLVSRMRESQANRLPLPEALSLADFEEGFQRANWG